MDIIFGLKHENIINLHKGAAKTEKNLNDLNNIKDPNDVTLNLKH